MLLKTIKNLVPIALGTLGIAIPPSVAEPTDAIAEPAPLTIREQPRQQSASQLVGLSQVTSVSQLSDVKPTDWAFQALQSLVERYGCIVGYADQSFRGNRSLSRYEFAAGLNACMDRINELIAAGTADVATKEDLQILQKLAEEFQEDLAEVRGRMDGLESRTATLEKQVFSTTTKLNGEVVLNMAGVFGSDRALNSDQQRTIDNTPAGPRRDAAIRNAYGAAGQKLQDNPIFGDRIRLNLITSFTGQDQLFTRLEAINISAFNAPVTGTNATRLSVDGTANLDNSVQLGKLYYRFPVGKKLSVIVDAIGGEFYDNVSTVNPFLSSAVQGSISRFGRFSPIYRASNTSSGSNTGSGVTVNYKLNKLLTLSAGYLARRSGDPSAGRGLFDGSYGTLAQLTVQPNRALTLGLAYAHAYFSGGANDVTVSGSYGSAFANAPFGTGVGNTTANPIGVATSANYYGLQANYQVAPWLAISGWGLYTQAIAENGKGLANVSTGAKASIWSWMVGLAFPDALRKGNLAALIVGMPPKVTSNDFGANNPSPSAARRQDADTAIHLEALYRYQLNNNISITPGLIVVLNPENNSKNDPIYVGVIRTTFRF